MGGCRHSKPDRADSKKETAEMRKKVSNVQQKSRQNSVSVTLTGSEDNVDDLKDAQKKEGENQSLAKEGNSAQNEPAQMKKKVSTVLQKSKRHLSTVLTPSEGSRNDTKRKQKKESDNQSAGKGAKMRKKSSSALQQSRRKHLSTVLMRSEDNLFEHTHTKEGENQSIVAKEGKSAQNETGELRTKIHWALQKSRGKHLSTVLMDSEEDNVFDLKDTHKQEGENQSIAKEGHSAQKQTGELRKKIRRALQKSRRKHLSAILMPREGSWFDLKRTHKKEGENQSIAKEGNSDDNGFKLGTGYGSQSNLEESEPLVESSRRGSGGSQVDRSSWQFIRRKRKGGEDSDSSSSSSSTGSTRRLSFDPHGRYDRSASFYDEVDLAASLVNPANYSYHFENLVFEGGGNKGLAYCGAVRYLEELGMMQNIKRFAGASAGGMVAGLLALGYTSYEIEEFLSDRIDRIFLDASCGYLSLLPNIVRSFGWNPGKKIYKWFGDKIKAKTGDAEYTFQQLYQERGITLCIIVTNLSQMTTEYCHPKTSPYMPIRTALRMSMAIPGLFSAMKYTNLVQEDVYVDGGVLCNYPVHCFDGWFLSMDPQDSFLQRLQPLRDIPFIMERHSRFGTFNEKTIGMLLYSDSEEDILRISLETRVGCLEPAKPKPETKLYLQREKAAKQKKRAEREYAQVVQAVESFLRVLKKYNMDVNDVINREELEAAFSDEEEFPRCQANVLFGEDFTVSDVFHLLDRDNNNMIHFNELMRFIEENGVCLQSRFLGYERKEIKNFVGFLNTLTSTLTFNVQKLYVEERDLERTVGINTGHVQTTDFNLEQPDRDFIIERGYNSMKAFLRYFIVCKPDHVTELPKLQDPPLSDVDPMEYPNINQSPPLSDVDPMEYPNINQSACGNPDTFSLPAGELRSWAAQEVVLGEVSAAQKSPKVHWKSDQLELVVRNGRGSSGGLAGVDVAQDVIVHEDLASPGQGASVEASADF